MYSYKIAHQKGDDARRLADTRKIVNVLNLYYDDNQAYPLVNVLFSRAGGWDVNYLPGFLRELSPKYISSGPKDPINSYSGGGLFANAGRYYYAYYNYPVSLGPGYGCTVTTDFAVIAVSALEAGIPKNTSKAMCGTQPWGCPPVGILNVCRDWGAEFDYSTMVVK
jgi:hypothetical protein